MTHTIRLPVVYLAGPIRGHSTLADHNNILLNVMAARTWALDLWQRGFAVICPHLNTLAMDGALPFETIMQGDLELVHRADAVFMLPGWESSAGSKIEKAEAERVGTPTFTTLPNLLDWKIRDFPCQAAKPGV